MCVNFELLKLLETCEIITTLPAGLTILRLQGKTNFKEFKHLNETDIIYIKNGTYIGLLINLDN